jgi:leucyl-tRNA synthetase
MARPEYEFEAIEKKWQQHWQKGATFRAPGPGDRGFDASKPKFYVLIEFPYPSGAGLHVGHPRSYTALDAVARHKRMLGFNVLYPIGWDAFGLPTENFALKTGTHPRTVTERNVANFRRQLKRLGFSFDWEREVNTTDPGYYKWTQWIFLKLLEKGLAYKAEVAINWCQDCKVGLANEEVVGGVCERCGGQVVRRMRTQWMLRITRYAERLLDDLGALDFLDKIKAQQVNWIGRSVGARIVFKAAEVPGVDVPVFTTRPDTLFGVTFMVLAPEHPLLGKLLAGTPGAMAIQAAANQMKAVDINERTNPETEKIGVFTGRHVLNPANGEKVPLYVANYALMDYGTGVVMGVPAHDQRDFLFAKKYGLAVKVVIRPPDRGLDAATMTAAYEEPGVQVNSGQFDGLPNAEAIGKITAWLASKGAGGPEVTYHLRDWVFSRQRYWGEPIPVVHCDKCGVVPLPQSELPLLLPEVERFQTTETGESPLALIPEWVNVKCPKCKGPGRRETDTMPQWAGSSWYFLRYLDPDNDRELAARKALEYWMPVDWYNGGMEHTTLHLLYSRFWHKFLFDIGVVNTPEPYEKRTSHGMVLGENGEKMSKARGNVVNPDEMVERFGADAFRLYEMFMGAFDQAIPWSTEGLNGMYRFLNRVWELAGKVSAQAQVKKDVERLIHQTIKKVGDDIESMKFNTALAQLMTLANRLGQEPAVRAGDFRRFVLLLSPFAPHIAEELWEEMGEKPSVSGQPWPAYDAAAAKEEELEIPVQVNGKLRGKVTVPADAGEELIKERALADSNVRNFTSGKQVAKIVYVPGRLVNVVVK